MPSTAVRRPTVLRPGACLPAERRRWYGEDAGGGWEGCLEGVEVRCGEGGWVGGGGGGVEMRRGVWMAGLEVEGAEEGPV